jgi:hypothetical protein
MAENPRLSSLRRSVNALLDSAEERAESDPGIATCEVNAAILVLGEFKNVIIGGIEDPERREMERRLADPPPPRRRRQRS